jgi:hypothetical protein
MAKIKVYTFNAALAECEEYSRRHLLLGNGFSIACRANIFRYDKLFEQADFSKLSPSARKAFDLLGTMDFERVIRVLRDAAKLALAYGLPTPAVEQMISDANGLKKLLVQTIAKSHPDRPSDISDDEYGHCRQFLSHFTTVYTLNYDLLLYWTRMHATGKEPSQSDDGFRTSQDDIDSFNESDYVVWEPAQSHDQNMWFLHGALHVFDAGTEVRKYTWNRTGIRLIKQIQDALDRDLFPLFVSEGTTAEKYERIRHSDYLAKAYRSFEAIQHCLFIYGHSLAENDEHFLRVIERGKLTHVFVGLHGDPSSEANKRIIRRAQGFSGARSSSRPLRVDFFDSASARVWRD